jgi:hypothetical protein
LRLPDTELKLEGAIKVGDMPADELAAEVDKVLKSEIPKVEKKVNAKMQIDVSAIIPAKIDFKGLERVDKNKNLQAFLKDLHKADDRWAKTENLKKYANELNHVGDAFGSLSELAGAAGMKEAALAFAIAKIIAGGAAAIAEAFATETWVGGIAAAVGVAASIASTIASFNSTANKYATGGIVPGSSYRGDNVRALVNSGEMILNRGQQRNLFDLLDYGGAGSGNDVTFHISGSDLVGTMNNYNRKFR